MNNRCPYCDIVIDSEDQAYIDDQLANHIKGSHGTIVPPVNPPVGANPVFVSPEPIKKVEPVSKNNPWKKSFRSKRR